MKWLIVIFLIFPITSHADPKEEPKDAYAILEKKLDELSLDFKKYTDSCMDNELKSSWRNSYFPDGGIRAHYCHMKEKIGINFIEDTLGEKIFTNFDLLGDKNLYSKNNFGHYNKKFLEKVSIEIEKIALKENPLAQKFYDLYVRDLLRIYYVTYKGIGINPDLKKSELTEYSVKIEKNESIDIYKYVECENIDAYWPESFKIEWTYKYYVKSTAAFFWLRRDIDKTENQMASIIKQSLAVFDNEFLNSVEKMNIDDKYKDSICHKTTYEN